MKQRDQYMWAYLLHLGYNMWNEADNFNVEGYIRASDTLRFDEDTYRQIIAALRDAGCNTIMLDIGEGIQYQSHPELSVKGSWSHEKLRAELASLRAMGFTVYPKLNFSTCHDEWLGEYARMVSTKVYYEVCRDVIREVSELFDRPAYFHIGMDEEDYETQANYLYACMRQDTLWWHDLQFFCDECRKNGATPIMWSDTGRYIQDFFEKIPRDVVQNNWYYWSYWNDEEGDYRNALRAGDLTEARLAHHRAFLKLFDELESAGCPQLVAGSCWNCDENFENLVRYAGAHIREENLVGFMQTPWEPTVADRLPTHMNCIAQMKRAYDAMGERAE